MTRRVREHDEIRGPCHDHASAEGKLNHGTISLHQVSTLGHGPILIGQSPGAARDDTRQIRKHGVTISHRHHLHLIPSRRSHLGHNSQVQAAQPLRDKATGAAISPSGTAAPPRHEVYASLSRPVSAARPNSNDSNQIPSREHYHISPRPSPDNASSQPLHNSSAAVELGHNSISKNTAALPPTRLDSSSSRPRHS